jgi:hypothetical protein
MERRLPDIVKVAYPRKVLDITEVECKKYNR